MASRRELQQALQEAQAKLQAAREEIRTAVSTVEEETALPELHDSVTELPEILKEEEGAMDADNRSKRSLAPDPDVFGRRRTDVGKEETKDGA